MADLQAIELNKNIRFCSFDIESMYTNINKTGIIKIINTVLENKLEIDRNIQKRNNTHILNSDGEKIISKLIRSTINKPTG
jgi:hypothetical protein